MFYIKFGCTIIQIDDEDILYFYQNLHDTIIITKKGTFRAKKTKVKELFKCINGNFYFCHNYLVINFDKIISVSKFYVTLEGNLDVYMCYGCTLKIKKKLKKITF